MLAANITRADLGRKGRLADTIVAIDERTYCGWRTDIIAIVGYILWWRMAVQCKSSILASRPSLDGNAAGEYCLRQFVKHSCVINSADRAHCVSGVHIAGLDTEITVATWWVVVAVVRLNTTRKELVAQR